MMATLSGLGRARSSAPGMGRAHSEEISDSDNHGACVSPGAFFIPGSKSESLKFQEPVKSVRGRARPRAFGSPQ